MNKLFFLITFFICFNGLGQLKTYQINNTSINSPIFPTKILNSNDGNILIVLHDQDGIEFSTPVILKIKPNGDTLFLKNSDSKDLFITSNGNIITNAKDYNILTKTYSNSYLSMYDKNFNRKWQLDFSANATNLGGIPYSPPIVESIIEINPNQFLASVSGYSVYPNATMSVDKTNFVTFDSSGNITSNLKYNFHYSAKFINKIANNELMLFNTNPGWTSDYISKLSLTSNTVTEYSSNIYSIKDAYVHNSKFYLGGYNQTSNYIGKIASIGCIDVNGNTLWNKKIIPYDSLKENQITDIEFLNNNLICKYKQDTTEYILRIDTLGNILQSVRYDNDRQGYFCNLLNFNNQIITVKRENNNNFRFVQFDSLFNDICLNISANTSTLNVFNGNNSNSTSSKNCIPDNFLFTTSNLNLPNNYYNLFAANTCPLFSIFTSDVERNKENEVFFIYPNPTNNKIQISNTNFINNDFFIRLTDLLGREILGEVYKEDIDLTNFQNGIYFLNIYDKEKLIATKKIIKQ
jgi:hypothetical protein